MARKTVNLVKAPLDEADPTHSCEGKGLGGTTSEAEAPAPPPHWTSKPMGARIDLADKDALYKILDEE